MKIPYKAILFAPYALLLLGVASNQAAIYANHHLMPVLWPAGCFAMPMEGDYNHSCMVSSTHLKFLGDWIISNRGVSSIGDLMQDLGEKLATPFLYAWMALLAYKAIAKP